MIGGAFPYYVMDRIIKVRLRLEKETTMLFLQICFVLQQVSKYLQNPSLAMDKSHENFYRFDFYLPLFNWNDQQAEVCSGT